MRFRQILVLALFAALPGTMSAITTYNAPSNYTVGIGGIFSGIGEVVQYQGPACTGELISPNVVLTAAHCLGGTISVTFADAVGSPVYSVVQQVADPGYAGPGLDDVALLLLSTDAAPDVTIYNLSTNSNSASLIGQEITLSGYGYTGQGQEQTGFGTLLAATNTYYGEYDASGGNALAMYFNSSGPSTEGFTCYGDSGGPSFQGNVLTSNTTPTILAIHDFITATSGTPNCSFGESAGDENVALFASFIATTEAAFSAPEPGTWAIFTFGLGLLALRRLAVRR